PPRHNNPLGKGCVALPVNRPPGPPAIVSPPAGVGGRLRVPFVYRRPMAELPMPSDVRKAAPAAPEPAAPADGPPDAGAESATLVAPPSLKLVVRLFVIPLLIVGAS